jgi:hypothetical protein
LPRKQSKNKVDQQIIQITREKKPENVEQLIKLVKENYPLPEQEILARILHLQEKEEISLKPHQTLTSIRLTTYLGSSRASWYWITIILTLTTTLVIFTIPEDAFPLVYARYILGSIFILWLPGYAFIKALFPLKELDSIERVALSIGMSLALVPITGLLLNYTPWGIRITPITISLLALTVTFATAATIREHQKIRQSIKTNT